MPATHIWTGNGANNLVSNGQNFAGVAPVAGDTLVFDGLAGNNPNKPADFDVAAVAVVDVRPTYTGALGFTNDFTATTLFVADGVTLNGTAGKKISSPNLHLVSGVRDVTINDATVSLSPGGGGSFGGPKQVTFAGAGRFEVGIGAWLTVAGELNLTATPSKNEGNLLWDAGDVNQVGGTVVSNYGTITANNGGTWDGGGRIDNYGTFQKTGGTGTTAIDVLFSDLAEQGGMTYSPEVKATSGTLAFNSQLASTHKAKFTAGAGAVLRIGAPVGDWTLKGGTTFVGNGTVELSTARVAIPMNETVETLPGVTVKFLGTGTKLTGGQFDSRGTFEWESGTLSQTTVRAFGAVQFKGVDDKTIAEAELHLRGATVWDDGRLVLDRGSVRNYGTFEVKNERAIRDAGPLQQPSTFENHGTFTKTAGDATPVGVNFRNYGELLLNGRAISFSAVAEQSQGATRLGGGTLGVTGTFVVSGGVFSGTGTVNGNLLCRLNGEVNLGPTIGTLTINGNYEQANQTSKLRLRYDANTGLFDSIAISGTAKLAGELIIGVPNGDPEGNTAWTPFSALGGITGTFDADPAGYTLAYNPCAFEVQKLNLQGQTP